MAKGRKPKDPASAKTKLVHVRLSNDEFNKLEELSEELMMTKSDILRDFLTWDNNSFKFITYKALQNMRRIEYAGKEVLNGRITRINFKGVIFEKSQQAKWVSLDEGWCTRFMCSNCFNNLDYKPNYCPCCGSRMSSEEEDESDAVKL